MSSTACQFFQKILSGCTWQRFRFWGTLLAVLQGGVLCPKQLLRPLDRDCVPFAPSVGCLSVAWADWLAWLASPSLNLRLAPSWQHGQRCNCWPWPWGAQPRTCATQTLLCQSRNQVRPNQDPEGDRRNNPDRSSTILYDPLRSFQVACEGTLLCSEPIQSRPVHCIPLRSHPFPSPPLLSGSCLLHQTKVQ